MIEDDNLNSLADEVDILREALKKTQLAVEEKFTGQNKKLSESATNSIEDILQFLKTLFTKMKQYDIDIQIPPDFDGDENEEEPCDLEDSQNNLYLLKVNDEFKYFSRTLQDIKFYQERAVEVLRQNYSDNYYLRSELTNDDQCITYYGVYRHSILRIEKKLFSVEYIPLYTYEQN